MQLLKPPWVNHDGKKAIFSIDIHPDGSRFATGGQGQDSSGRIVIWNIKPVINEDDELNEKVPKLLCQLDHHLGCVNCVRWSKSGQSLASAGDDKVIVIWQISGYGGGKVFGSNVVNVESWRSIATLRGHNGDVLDVAWSPTDLYLASASVDNKVIIWNALKWPEQIRIINGHTGLVKGVTWDPVGRYLASQSDDKSLRIWKTVDWSAESAIKDPFLECGGTTTVLRLSWSPDGQYLVSAHAMNNGGPTAQIIERDGWNADKDFVGHRKAITCVSFNPNILKKQDPKTGKSVQYCCVAIGSRDRAISIWFTSLKRPLFVIHELFDDTVLDLNWSKCGKYLMSVSQDGTLAFIKFSNKEIGFPLSEEETSNYHVKLYGTSVADSGISRSTIIESYELLKLQEEEKNKSKLSSHSVREKKSGAALPLRVPINKQIEVRTIDGKRRITPMFIPPQSEGDNSNKNLEPHFSSSTQEKSKIIIEKVDGVVTPNVSVTCKTINFKSKKTLSMPPVELEDVPAGLTARLERPTIPVSEKVSDALPPVATKRKFEEAHPVTVKRKRGRPPLHERSQVATPPSAPIAPPLPPVSHLTPPPPPSAVVPTPLSSAAQFNSQQFIKPVDVLPEASISKSSRIQIPGTSSIDGITPLLIIENNWRTGASATSLSSPNLHRVSRSQPYGPAWVMYFTSPVISAKATDTFAVVACQDSSLHTVCIESGELLLPAFFLKGRVSHLLVQNCYVLAVTTYAHLLIWNVLKKEQILSESVRHLVEIKGVSVKTVQLMGNSSSSVTPVLILSNGEAFTYCTTLKTWLQIGESADIRRCISAEYTILPVCHAGNMPSRPMSAILLQSSAYSRTSTTKPIVSQDVRQGMTESFLKKMITSSKYLQAVEDYKFWFKRLVQFYIKEGFQSKLRKVFDDLLGPGSSVSTSTFKWEVDVDINKHELLEDFLKQIAIAENSLQLQRLYTEYKEQLDRSIDNPL